MDFLKQKSTWPFSSSIGHNSVLPLDTLPSNGASDNALLQNKQTHSNVLQSSIPMLTQGTRSSRDSSPISIPEDVFSDSEPEASTNHSKGRHLDEAYSKQYELRPGPRSDPENVWTSWQDVDESGNYDPTAKLRKRPVTKKRKSGEKTITALEERPFKKAKIVSPPVARREGHAFVVTLSFDSPYVLSQFQQYQGQDNWPEKPYNKLALPDPERFNGEEYFGLLEDSGSYKLRSRYNADPLFCTFHRSSPIDQDLTGHPAARGCVACYKIGETCSLLKSPLEYPCESCKGECDCELITPPKWKRTCESCRKSKNKKCSYRYRPDDEEEHRLPCVECSESGYHCIAGPRIDSSAELPSRIDLDYDWDFYRAAASKGSGKGRRYVACTLCRSNRKRCSLRQEDNPPCRACKEAGFDCTFESLDSSKQNNNKHGENHQNLTNGHHNNRKYQATPEPSKRLKTAADIFRPGVPIPHWTEIAEEPIEIPDSPATIEPSDSASCTSKHGTYQDGTLTIRTAYCHPIHFNHDSSPPLSTSSFPPDPCHFCTYPHYGIFGLGWREVLALRWDRGHGYEELDNGHGAQGEEQTRMCLQCTNARMRICGCARHEVAPLPAIELTPARMDQEAAYNAVMAMKKRKENAGGVEYRWCSICPSLALYECVTLQETDEFGQVVPPKAKAELGCGLLLCDACALAVMATSGDLQAVLNAGPDAEVGINGEAVNLEEMRVDEECELGERYPLGWRADAEFLKKDGLLMQAALAGQ